MMEGVFAFEDIDDDLPLLPLSARRALDVAGRRLSLVAWQKLSIESRRTMVAEGAKPVVDVARVRNSIATAEPAATAIAELDETTAFPEELRVTLTEDQWLAMPASSRFALRHLLKRNNPQRLREALEEIAPARGSARVPTHLDEHGNARMVDVGDKKVTRREATAAASVHMRPDTLRLVAGGNAPKGDVLATARIAGIMASKRTSELIPLCHPIQLTRVAVSFDIDETQGIVRVVATALAHDRTGVEMEAMTAASVAALTIYDMLKGVERGITIQQVVLLEKSGGRSGHYRYGAPETL